MELGTRATVRLGIMDLIWYTHNICIENKVGIRYMHNT